MTDEQIDALEVSAKMIETSCGPFASFYNEDFSKVILDLIAELRQTRKERDWLAEEGAKWYAGYRSDVDGPCVSHAEAHDLLKRAKEATCPKS